MRDEISHFAIACWILFKLHWFSTSFLREKRGHERRSRSKKRTARDRMAGVEKNVSDIHSPC